MMFIVLNFLFVALKNSIISSLIEENCEVALAANKSRNCKCFVTKENHLE